ncbi:FMN-binding protein [Enterococcus devriesei]|uniref:extracellular electron transfer flavoprotein PplA n=1 Tax=Enterococcus devriesei TaxID=319970 RepID=UPI001C10323F|nr:extracellular electron transfer flavoprotein PplA [Enterococcus devriesei]MBU5365668.1 FMN-binding protein [Enterococcus devriesei]MDT2822701.1 FMN-binding protein [Enterococcus devriesei]
MKMKKIVSGFAVVAFSTLALAACGGSNDKEAASNSSTSSSEAAKPAEKEAGGDLKDGSYKLEEKNYDHGYRVVFDMTVKDGKITKSNYDYLNEDGKSKQKDADYEKSMKEKTKTGPKEYIPALNKSLEETQNPDAVEVVTGATHSSENFKNYSQQLVQAAQAGDTKTIEIDNGAAMKDGTYKLEEKNYSNGYRTIFSMTVAGGKITESNFDMVDKDGKSKKDDADYEKNMKAKSGVGPKEYIEQLNKGLVEKGAPADVEVVTGATHSSHAFQTYAAQLVNAAEKGNTNTIQVDNIVTKK